MSGTWLDTARETLLRLRVGAVGWGYRTGSAPAVEPTALACLGLLATDRDPGSGGPPAEVAASADWLTGLQGRDGSLGVSAGIPSPGWATPYGLLLWSALGGYTEQRGRAAAWLLGLKGGTSPVPPPAERVSGHDTSIVGWPWVADTHSWLEPTALAVLALGRDGRPDHPRVQEGLRLIRDRSVPSGGWNYGNTSVFGRELRPQPAPTGLALLASARSGERSDAVGRAVGYLRTTLPKVRAAQSLGWGVLGLRAWGSRPDAAEGWLEEACDQVIDRPDPAPRLAYLLLAAGARSLEVLGLPPETENRHDG